jgi:tripartite-type tricarboxylate transporter receptor subunit TctC
MKCSLRSSRSVFFRLLSAAALATVPLLATAQAFPSKPLRLVVPFPAGGATDVLARIVGAKLAEGLGQPVVIDNRAGASGAIATEHVAKSAPDGYTLLMATASTQAINPAVSKVPFDPVGDFTAVGIVGTAPLGLVIHPSVQARDVAELVALAKKSPGKLDMASFGTGTASHLAGELFKSMTGIFMVHVPYKGGAPAMTDLIAGQVSVYFDTLSNTLQPAKAGRIRLLAVTSPRRVSAVPEVPTVAEAGVPGYEAVTWFGLFGPARVPAEAVARLNAEIGKLIAQPDVRQKLLAQGTDPVAGPPEVLGNALKADYAKWAKLVKDRGLKMD